MDSGPSSVSVTPGKGVRSGTRDGAGVGSGSARLSRWLFRHSLDGFQALGCAFCCIPPLRESHPDGPGRGRKLPPPE